MGCFDFTYADNGRNIRMGRGYLYLTHALSDACKVVLQWYLDMNTGGTVHSEEEIARVRNLLEQEQSKEE